MVEVPLVRLLLQRRLLRPWESSGLSCYPWIPSIRYFIIYSENRNDFVVAGICQVINEEQRKLALRGEYDFDSPGEYVVVIATITFLSINVTNRLTIKLERDFWGGKF